MLKLRHEFAVEAAKSFSCEEPTSLLCKHVIHPATGQGQCQADEVIFTSVLWGVSCNIFDVWVFSALQHSLGEDGSHSVLARVVPLQQHVLELRVHILNLLVHLLERQGYWQHTITSYLIYNCFDRTLSEMKRLCPPGMFFMMCLSIFSFSSTATPLSIRIGGWAASKFDLGNGLGDIYNKFVKYVHSYSFSTFLTFLWNDSGIILCHIW